MNSRMAFLSDHLLIKLLLSRLTTIAILVVSAGVAVANLHELAVYPLTPYADHSFPEGCPPSNFDAALLLTIGYFAIVGIAAFGARGSFARLLMLVIAVTLAVSEITLNPSHLDGQHCGDVLAGQILMKVALGMLSIFISNVSFLWYLATSHSKSVY
jgi:hypothetical protein